uniref:Uncharacterized protein n=1 Tax=Panagrolaimus sp. PS1159 TaxID=55785 RepID=A0AC35FMU8_9BILA
MPPTQSEAAAASAIAGMPLGPFITSNNNTTNTTTKPIKLEPIHSPSILYLENPCTSKSGSGMASAGIGSGILSAAATILPQSTTGFSTSSPVISSTTIAASSSSTSSSVATTIPPPLLSSLPPLTHPLQPLHQNNDLTSALAASASTFHHQNPYHSYSTFVDPSLTAVGAAPYCWQTNGYGIDESSLYQYHHPQHHLQPTSTTSNNNNNINSNSNLQQQNNGIIELGKLQTTPYENLEPLGSYAQPWVTYNPYLSETNDKMIDPTAQYFDKNFYNQQFSVCIFLAFLLNI